MGLDTAMTRSTLWAAVAVLCGLVACSQASHYQVGRGLADITGLVAEAPLYGYADPFQDARGLHLRQFARAFIVTDSDGGSRVAIVALEIPMVTHALRLEVLERLQPLYGDLYTEANVLLAPTHTHSGPGGHHTYRMYAIPAKGFVKQTFDAYAGGIVKSIQLAHNDLRPGSIFINSGELVDASTNRSPASYDNNPAEERARYEYNTDKEMILLKFTAEDGEDLGIISFFAVHVTSMKNFNHLVSSDNKGYAALRFEQDMNPGSHPGHASFVTAFVQMAEGDASPNTNGARCEGTDELCDYVTSTCPEDPKNPALCTGRGPAGEQFEDTRIIGHLQYQKAKELYLDAVDHVISGPIDFRFQWVNMSDVTLEVAGETVTTCRPSMGFAFAAGATDGPGVPPFHQGDTQGNPAIQDLVEQLFPTSDTLKSCQKPKPILLPTGEISEEWPWQPEILPLQILRIGDLFFVGGPGEFTTMSVRRIKTSVRQALLAEGLSPDIQVIFVGLANAYSSYVTTQEEYQVQRYEGASTIYGQHTVAAYQQHFNQLATALAAGNSVERGDLPPDLRGLPRDSVGDIKTDVTPSGMTFGDVIADVRDKYQQGETVSVTFVSGNPRNDMKLGSTYLEVQKLSQSDTWSVVATDAYWETKFLWSSSCQGINLNLDCVVLGRQQSNVTITWDIPTNQQPGQYRLVHYGQAKRPIGGVVEYVATSGTFNLVARHGKYFWVK